MKKSVSKIQLINIWIKFAKILLTYKKEIYVSNIRINS